MKVLFSNPPWWGEHKRIRSGWFGKSDRWTSGVRAGSRWPFTRETRVAPGKLAPEDYLPYPFFLGYATTYVRKHTGADAVFRDSLALRETYDDYYAFLEASQFDTIVIESASPSWDHDSKLIKEIHRRLPKTRFIVTGPIAANAKSVMSNAPVSACIRGEYEKGVVKALGGQEGLIDFDLLTVEEMNAAPFPYFDGTYAHRYWDANPKGSLQPQAQVWSSRGCPYKCIFCVWPATMTGNDPDGAGKRTVRHYSADYMEEFLSGLVRTYGYRTIYFDDDTFNLGDKHVEKMCAVMRKIGLPWSAMCRADTSRLELWQEMKDSGCFGVKIGFESGNQSVIDTIVNKRLNLEEARQVAAEVKRVGLTIHGTFTYGLPGETREQMLDTKRYKDSLNLDTFQESGCAEIEGAPLHTLNSRELKRYPGAKLDEEYVHEKDGNVKFQKLYAELDGQVHHDRP